MDDISEKLFVPMVSRSLFHPNFKQIKDDENIKAVLKEWAKGFADRDHKLIKEFQTTFNSSFWEIYLFACLKELGLRVNFHYDAPDFIVEGDQAFNIEATVANHPQGGLPEWEKFTDGKLNQWDLEREIRTATIRIANAFSNKVRRFQRYYKSKEYVIDKPFVIAIEPFDSPYFFDQGNQPILRVLYGIDGFSISGHHLEIDSIKKDNGSTVPLGFFNDKKYSFISAVVYSVTATVGKSRVMSNDPRMMLIRNVRYNDTGITPNISFNYKNVPEEYLAELGGNNKNYTESLLDGTVIYHNPYAQHPLVNNKLFNNDIIHFYVNTEKETGYSYIPHNALIKRWIQIIQYRENAKL